jgi:L-ascorbate metabolism protein UlaG (beta-lactamase superfamily)
MHVRKIGHACVRLEQAGVTMVIDPGSFSAHDALDGADAVLITHEHADHMVVERLRAAAQRRSDLHIWTSLSVADLLAGAGLHAEPVAHGDHFRVADAFDVRVFGERHTIIHPDIPRVRNVGYLIDSVLFHPGDAFVVPEQPVDTLLLPV